VSPYIGTSAGDRRKPERFRFWLSQFFSFIIAKLEAATTNILNEYHNHWIISEPGDSSVHNFYIMRYKTKSHLCPNCQFFMEWLNLEKYCHLSLGFFSSLPRLWRWANQSLCTSFRKRFRCIFTADFRDNPLLDVSGNWGTVLSLYDHDPRGRDEPLPCHRELRTSPESGIVHLKNICWILLKRNFRFRMWEDLLPSSIFKKNQHRDSILITILKYYHCIITNRQQLHLFSREKM
jgi:hypothetical protein